MTEPKKEYKVVENISTCPVCNSDRLDWDATDYSSYSVVMFPFTCIDCGAECREIHELTYQQTSFIRKDELKNTEVK